MHNSVLVSIHQYLNAFAGLEDFWARFEAVFGTEYDVALAESLRAQWQAGDFSQLPAIAVISGNILGKALGGYASSRNTIYLADWFVAGATAQDLGAVVLEEIGHWLDAQVNVVDTPGDEGELFSAVVRSKTLTGDELSGLRAEDDTAIIYIDGEEVVLKCLFNVRLWIINGIIRVMK